MSVHYECVQGYNDRYIRNNKTNELMNWNTVCTLLNNLHKENNQLQSDLAKIIESKSKENKQLKEDIILLKKALWCKNCTINIKRLRELKGDL